MTNNHYCRRIPFFYFIFWCFSPFLFCTSQNKAQDDLSSLLSKVGRFNSALHKRDAREVYNLFNRQFQNETPFEKFATSFKRWIDGKKTDQIETRFINITGLIGQVSTWIWDEKRKGRYHYIFQSWVKTDDGWRLLWLSPLLDGSFRYGMKDLAAVQEILRLAIENALSPGGLEKKFVEFDIPANIVFLKKGRPEELNLLSPDSRVIWLTLEEIKRRHRALSLPFYFDFGQVRIIDNIATAYIDIIPIKKTGRKNPFSRMRGLQFQFRKENGQWQFVGYGSKW